MLGGESNSEPVFEWNYGIQLTKFAFVQPVLAGHQPRGNRIQRSFSAQIVVF
jgi:hypothetical protein